MAAWKYQINRIENELTVNKQDGLKSQIDRLKDAWKKGDISSLQQSIKQISEMVKSVSGSLEKWKKIYSDLEKCGLLA